MSRREFVQLAQTFDPHKHGIGGWYVSEKLDGMRAYWDGGWTAGSLTSEVLFANTVKDYRRVTPPRSTGLWTRYAKPIAAPTWWLAGLPDFPLDGELYLGPGCFQELISIVKKFEPVDEEWARVTYRVFDLPSDYTFLAPGKINNPQWSVQFDDMRDKAPRRPFGPMSFHKVCRMIELGKIDLGDAPALWHPQTRLPMQTAAALEGLDLVMPDILDRGGEGVMIRKPESVWTPIRTWDLLKLKPWKDSEALVTGYIWGRGKLEGLMGAMIVDWHGKTFELSGFTDAERVLVGIDKPLIDPVPGEIVADCWVSEKFPRGSIVTFKYRELTNDGVPKEARYWRKR